MLTSHLHSECGNNSEFVALFCNFMFMELMKAQHMKGTKHKQTSICNFGSLLLAFFRTAKGFLSLYLEMLENQKK